MESRDKCRAGVSKFLITPDMHLIPCASMKGFFPRIDQNDISKHTFDEIVNSDLYEDFYELKKLLLKREPHECPTKTFEEIRHCEDCDEDSCKWKIDNGKKMEVNK